MSFHFAFRGMMDSLDRQYRSCLGVEDQMSVALGIVNCQYSSLALHSQVLLNWVMVDRQHRSFLALDFQPTLAMGLRRQFTSWELMDRQHQKMACP